MAWHLSMKYKDMTFWEQEIESDDEVVAWWTIRAARDQVLPLCKQAENPAIAKFFKRCQPGDIELRIDHVVEDNIGDRLVLQS